MNTKLNSLAAAFGLLLMSAAAPAQTAPASPALPAQFDPLLQRSMFTRSHFPAATFPAGPAKMPAALATAPRPPVFFGVLQNPHEVVAFLEDRQTGKVTLIHEHDRLSAGTVEKITLHYILLRESPALPARQIDIGYDLAGGAK